MSESLVKCPRRIGATALHYAANRGDTKSTQLLVKNGANVKARTINGMTALHIAARDGNYSLAKLLLQLGADATVKADGKTPLDIARTSYVTIINVGKNPSRATRAEIAKFEKSDAQTTALPANRRTFAALFALIISTSPSQFNTP